VTDKNVAVFSTENRAEVPIYPLDRFVPTETGNEQIHAGSTRLPAAALEILVMLDGKNTVGHLEQKMPQIPAADLRNVLRSLLAANLIRPHALDELSGGIGVDFDAFFKAASGGEPSAPAVEKSADLEALKGAPELERQGYYVCIARQAVKAHTAASAGKFQALLVEDDPDMAALVKRLLERDAFAVSACSKRDEVIARLRQRPTPDILMLDVMLPDLNGFDLLQKLKAHAQLKTMPVVIVTANAERESVMRGIALGADGYITKPFDHATLVRGVKAVLGL
jgi:CheY-like chemotaxis protein